MSELPDGLVAWARLSGPSEVLAEIRRRAEKGFQTERGTLRVELDPARRREVARLLGTPWDVSGRPVRLQDLAVSLADHGLTVRGFLEALLGDAVTDQRQLRADRRASADAERADVRAMLHAAGVADASADTWLADPGLPQPGTGDLRHLTEQTIRVWRSLPWTAGPPKRLAQLAATVAGNAHALDARESLGRAVSRLIATTTGLPKPVRAGRDWRQAWAAAGIRCDGISSRVLVLNLPLTGDAPAARWSRAVPGEPAWLSLRSLTGDWSAAAGTPVFVCENPTVIEAAADELGERCPPMVCTDGIPSIAALDLLSVLASAGCTIHVRADIDEAGFIVVDQIRSAAPSAATWRFDGTTYLQHVKVPGAVGTARVEDDSLSHLRRLYERGQMPLHEEVILDDLLGDLSARDEDNP